jgi:hypothetical protein
MMLPFFTLAAVAPQRQRTFRWLAAAHVVMLVAAALVLRSAASGAMILGQIALTAGIVEGALLLGWRLTQLPKSQALEFLLVSPLRPTRVFLGEAVVGMTRLALLTLAGLPVYVLALQDGMIQDADLVPLLVCPWLWGTVTGLGLADWAYEPIRVRLWAERIVASGMVLYLIVGVLAAEQLPRWVNLLPGSAGAWLASSFRGLHEYNPFGVLKHALEHDLGQSWPRLMVVSAVGAISIGLLAWRCSRRLHGHFQDLHYKPIVESRKRRPPMDERPLSWWAVRRVSQYAGRINLWLAGGFGLLYAVYVVGEADWPPWLGKQVFVMFDCMGGIPAVTTALVLLAAVPAAFQYGLWDSSAQDRCRRLELLLLTELEGRAYWDAAAAAAWRRGRGYFAVALLLWTAGWLSGRLTPIEALAAATAGVLLWCLYFALGFQAFSKGLHANFLGLTLTLAAPLLVAGLMHQGWQRWAELLPPGAVYQPGGSGLTLAWCLGPCLAGLASLCLARRGLTSCIEDLRRWYDRNHGVKVME